MVLEQADGVCTRHPCSNESHALADGHACTVTRLTLACYRHACALIQSSSAPDLVWHSLARTKICTSSAAQLSLFSRFSQPNIPSADPHPLLFRIIHPSLPLDSDREKQVTLPTMSDAVRPEPARRQTKRRLARMPSGKRLPTPMFASVSTSCTTDDLVPPSPNRLPFARSPLPRPPLTSTGCPNLPRSAPPHRLPMFAARTLSYGGTPRGRIAIAEREPQRQVYPPLLPSLPPLSPWAPVPPAPRPQSTPLPRHIAPPAGFATWPRNPTLLRLNLDSHRSHSPIPGAEPFAYARPQQERSILRARPRGHGDDGDGLTRLVLRSHAPGGQGSSDDGRGELRGRKRALQWSNDERRPRPALRNGPSAGHRSAGSPRTPFSTLPTCPVPRYPWDASALGLFFGDRPSEQFASAPEQSHARPASDSESAPPPTAATVATSAAPATPEPLEQACSSLVRETNSTFALLDAELERAERDMNAIASRAEDILRRARSTGARASEMRACLMREAVPRDDEAQEEDEEEDENEDAAQRESHSEQTEP